MNSSKLAVFAGLLSGMQSLRRPSVTRITTRQMSFYKGLVKLSLLYLVQRFTEHCPSLSRAASLKSWISAKIKCCTIPTILIIPDTAISSVWIAIVSSNLKTETLILWKIVSRNAWAFRPLKSSRASKPPVMNSSAVVRALTVTCNPLRRASFLSFASTLTFGPHHGSFSRRARRPRFDS